MKLNAVKLLDSFVLILQRRNSWTFGSRTTPGRMTAPRTLRKSFLPSKAELWHRLILCSGITPFGPLNFLRKRLALVVERTARGKIEGSTVTRSTGSASSIVPQGLCGPLVSATWAQRTHIRFSKVRVQTTAIWLPRSEVPGWN